jgi:hypothetical protein
LVGGCVDAGSSLPPLPAPIADRLRVVAGHLAASAWIAGLGPAIESTEKR